MSTKRFTTTNVLELDSRSIVDESKVTRVLNETELRAKEYIFHLHPSSYGRTYFLVYQGKLRQFKMLRTFLNPWNYIFSVNNMRVIAIHEIEICGMGKVYVAHNNGDGTNFPCKVYHSPDEYKSDGEAYLGYNADKLSELQPFPFDLVYEPSFVHNYHYVAKMWKWDGTKAVAVNVNRVPMFYSYDENGLSIPNADDFALPQGYYKTKAECEEDNAIEVEYFATDEEQQGKKEKKTEVCFMGSVYNLTSENAQKVKDYIESLK